MRLCETEEWQKYLIWCDKNNVKPIVIADPNSFIYWIRKENINFSLQILVKHIRNSDIAKQGWETRKEEEMVMPS